MIEKRKFVLDGPPRGQGRPRWGNGRAYKAREDVSWESSIAAAYWRDNPRAPKYTGQVHVTIEAYLPIPQSANRAARFDMAANKQPALKKPDVDNVAKAVLDALNGVAWNDDKQITLLIVQKLYSDDPHLTVRLRGVSE
ncbi:MAG: RusA family crossover junction endodeoxyribonuclease [Clostridia bacterium]|nr:RusA family crossover junction endodeoxyribonuclease [Clostridia bacterium]